LQCVYDAGVDIRRRLDGKATEELDHAQRLCQTTIAKLRGRGLGEAEWVREAGAQCGGVVAYHATACATPQRAQTWLSFLFWRREWRELFKGGSPSGVSFVERQPGGVFISH